MIGQLAGAAVSGAFLLLNLLFMARPDRIMECKGQDFTLMVASRHPYESVVVQSWPDQSFVVRAWPGQPTCVPLIEPGILLAKMDGHIVAQADIVSRGNWIWLLGPQLFDDSLYLEP